MALGQKHAAPFIEDAVADAGRRGRATRIVGLVLAPHYAARLGRRVPGAPARRGRRARGVPVRRDRQLAPRADLPRLPRRRRARRRSRRCPSARRCCSPPTPCPSGCWSTTRTPTSCAPRPSAVAEAVGLDRWAGWSLCWQSAGRTPEPWRGPDILEVIRRPRRDRSGRRRARVPAGLRERPPRGGLRPRHRGRRRWPTRSGWPSPAPGSSTTTRPCSARWPTGSVAARAVTRRSSSSAAGSPGSSPPATLAVAGAVGHRRRARRRSAARCGPRRSTAARSTRRPTPSSPGCPRASSCAARSGSRATSCPRPQRRAHVWSRGALRRLPEAPGARRAHRPRRAGRLRRSSPPRASSAAGRDLTDAARSRPTGDVTHRRAAPRPARRRGGRAARRPAGRRHQRRRHRPAEPGGHRAAARRRRPQRRALAHRGLPGAAGQRGRHQPRRCSSPRGRAWARWSTPCVADLDGARRRPSGRPRSSGSSDDGRRLAGRPRRTADACAADGVVLAAPGRRQRPTLVAPARGPRGHAASAAIPYASVALVGARRATARPSTAPLDGSGFLVPRGRGPHGHRLLVDVGEVAPPRRRRHGLAARRRSGATATTRALAPRRRRARRRRPRRPRATLMALRGPPVEARVTRWPRSFPQYRPGHLDRVAAIEADLAAATPDARGGRRRPARPRRPRLHPPGRRRHPPRPRRPRRLTPQPPQLGCERPRSCRSSHPSSRCQPPQLVVLRGDFRQSAPQGRLEASPIRNMWCSVAVFACQDHKLRRLDGRRRVRSGRGGSSRRTRGRGAGRRGRPSGR